MPIMPKIIVQKILAGGLIGFVAGDADRIAELAEERIHLFQGITGDAGDGGFGQVRRGIV